MAHEFSYPAHWMSMWSDQYSFTNINLMLKDILAGTKLDSWQMEKVNNWVLTVMKHLMQLLSL